MTTVPDRSTFESAYAGQAPWDIGKPQKAFLDVADRITGSILDAGCGTEDNALFFASRGHKVTGIDFLEEPITRARRMAAERRLTATFLDPGSGNGLARDEEIGYSPQTSQDEGRQGGLPWRAQRPRW